MIVTGTDQTWVDGPNFGLTGNGVLFRECLADAGCQPLYIAALRQIAANKQVADLAATARAIEAVIAPWRPRDPRREQSVADGEAQADAKIAFMAARPAELDRWLGNGSPPHRDPGSGVVGETAARKAGRRAGDTGCREAVHLLAARDPKRHRRTPARPASWSADAVGRKHPDQARGLVREREGTALARRPEDGEGQAPASQDRGHGSGSDGPRHLHLHGPMARPDESVTILLAKVAPVHYPEFALRLALDVVAIGILTHLLFLRRHGRRDLRDTFVIVNVCVFAALSVIGTQKISVGVAFGLFAILSIIRLRSEPYDNIEIAYFFGSLTLALINGFEQSQIVLVVILDAFVLATVYVIDHRDPPHEDGPAPQDHARHDQDRRRCAQEDARQAHGGRDRQRRDQRDRLRPRDDERRHPLRRRPQDAARPCTGRRRLSGEASPFEVVL